MKNLAACTRKTLYSSETSKAFGTNCGPPTSKSQEKIIGPTAYLASTVALQYRSPK